MTIVPLPVFEREADPKARGLSEEDLRLYDRLKPPSTVVVKYGAMGMIAEFPANLERTPGCGTRFVAQTPRGTEIAEMLTTTCSNGGCGKSLTRKEMLDYIENSGGKNYPFTARGRIIRIASADDLLQMERLNELKRPMLDKVRNQARQLNLPVKVVEVEPILGQECLTIYFLAQERLDLRDLAQIASREYHTRVDVRQIGEREEARLTADYERCGQHCCCKQFLKVLKPVPMKNAKMQKGTLDPLKISGRCGRLMCCLRYEDATYVELKANLPHRKTRVGTPEDGPGIVMDTQILTQLVLIQLESDGTRIAVPVEQLCDPEESLKHLHSHQQGRQQPRREDPLRGMSQKQVSERLEQPGSGENSQTGDPPPHGSPRGSDRTRTRQDQQDAYRERSNRESTPRQAPMRREMPDDEADLPAASDDDPTTTERSSEPSVQSDDSDDTARSPRRRRRRGRRHRNAGGARGAGDSSPDSSGEVHSTGSHQVPDGNETPPQPTTPADEVQSAVTRGPQHRKRRRGRRRRGHHRGGEPRQTDDHGTACESADGGP